MKVKDQIEQVAEHQAALKAEFAPDACCSTLAVTTAHPHDASQEAVQ